MDKKLVIRGVPHSLVVDGWWLEAAMPDRGAPRQDAAGTRVRFGRQAAAILLIVALGDFLFWQRVPGVSVAVFAVAILAVAAGHAGAAARWRPAALLIFCALPVADHLQVLSLAFLAAGLATALIWAQLPGPASEALLRATAGFLRRLPQRWLNLVDPRRITGRKAALAGGDGIGRALPTFLRNWAFPLGGGLVFAALLMNANPVLARLLQIDPDPWIALQRLLFWAGIAVFATPLITPVPTLVPAEPWVPAARRAISLTRLGINAASVLRALLLFNLLVGVQSLTDLSILLSGAERPAGMTFAEYARRGAYPLLATAMLAGAFALAARPHLDDHWLIRPLLLLWLAQNMVLSGAAALRLQLYIDAFGLTYLRIYAMIWIGLVGAGLGLTLWQVLAGRSNRWLVLRCAALGVATLYVCSFVNFAQLIAAQILTRPDPDLAYLCSLGPEAAGPIIASGLASKTEFGIELDGCLIVVAEIRDWREWGFRSWLTSRYVHRALKDERS
jgi:hypothetical protein